MIWTVFDKFLYDWRDVVNCFLKNIWCNVNIWKDSQNVKSGFIKQKFYENSINVLNLVPVLVALELTVAYVLEVE